MLWCQICWCGSRTLTGCQNRLWTVIVCEATWANACLFQENGAIASTNFSQTSLQSQPILSNVDISIIRIDLLRAFCLDMCSFYAKLSQESTCFAVNCVVCQWRVSSLVAKHSSKWRFQFLHVHSDRLMDITSTGHRGTCWNVLTGRFKR